MSWYYNYFLAYEEEDGKLYPYAPFDANGRLMDVLSKSRSFASHMHETFWELPKGKMSDELIKRFTYETYTGEEELDRVKYLKLSVLKLHTSPYSISFFSFSLLYIKVPKPELSSSPCCYQQVYP